MENKITLHCPEIDALVAAVNRLADALSQTSNTAPGVAAPEIPAVPATAPAVPMAAPVVPAAAPVVPATIPVVPVTAPAAPVTPPAPAPAAPVAAAPAYTLEQLSLAGRQLADAGRMADVQQLVAQFGAQTMMQIPPERYGEFATALRGKGARI